MQITDVRIKLNDIKDVELKAFVSFTIDGVFVVHGAKIIDTETGLHVAMPQIRLKSGEYKDVCHPISKEGRSVITKAVLDAYNAALEE